MNEPAYSVTAAWLVTPSETGTTIIRNPTVYWGKNGQIVQIESRDSSVYADLHQPSVVVAGNQVSTVNLGNSILAPGLVNAHTHAAMSLFRGAADDLSLMDWLQKRIWPMEGQLVDGAFVETGTRLAAAEMLLGGTTCCADMYFYPVDAARAFIAMGMRAQLAMPVIEFPTRYAADADRYISLALESRDALKSEPLLSFGFGPHAPYTIHDDTFKRIAALAAELAIPIHTHLQETAQEVDDALKKDGLRPTARMEQLGVLGPDFVGAHGVHLNAADIARLAKNAANIVHCPSSNLKLASGIAPISALHNAGVNVAIGTDGAASNNRLDMFEEMRLAALLAKVQSSDAAAFPAERAFHAATINGAKALGLGDVTGSIEIGKQADLIAISVDDVNLQPMFDPISHIVYTASRADVSHVWVNGQPRVTHRVLADDARRYLEDSRAAISEFAAKVAALR